MASISFETLNKIAGISIIILTCIGSSYSFISDKQITLSNNTQDIQELKGTIDKVIPQVTALSSQIGQLTVSVANNAKAIDSLQKSTEKLVVEVTRLEERVPRRYKVPE